MSDLKGTSQERSILVRAIHREQVELVRTSTAVNMYYVGSGARCMRKLKAAAQALLKLQALLQELEDFDRRFPRPLWGNP